MSILPSSSSSLKRSTTIPLSFDRFRNYDHKKNGKRNSERSRLRKIQIHPNNIQLTECSQNNHDASHLFNAANSSKLKTSSSSENFQNKKFSSSSCDIHLNFNVNKVNKTSQIFVCPPTPCMIGYRQKSLPTLVPTRIIKYPVTSGDTCKQSDIDCLDI